MWLRKNIQQTTTADEDGENLEYTYEEVYFRTTATKEEIEGTLNLTGNPARDGNRTFPMTQDQKIEALQNQTGSGQRRIGTDQDG